MSNLTPFQVLKAVADAVPSDCHPNIVIIGSLAAGFHFFGKDASKAVRTKDIDCVLEPFHAAVGTGQNLAAQLLAAGWSQQAGEAATSPGTAETPVDKLPVVRLYPPGIEQTAAEAWFLELLTVPKSSEVMGKEWTRLELPQGHFGLPTFRFLSVTAHQPLPVADLGIRYAQPMNMALANLLEHPTIKPDLMSSLFAGRAIKRSNKDLGRVLAITILADLDDYSPWAVAWQAALEACFPLEWKAIASNAGSGLRALLNSDEDLEQAQFTCANGLLASQPPTLDELRTAADRLLGDAIERLEEAANS